MALDCDQDASWGSFFGGSLGAPNMGGELARSGQGTPQDLPEVQQNFTAVLQYVA